MFIEKLEDKGKMKVGFRLNKKNINIAPEGRIRIARFEKNFTPYYNNGYYGDIYFYQMIKKWKYKKIVKEQKKLLIKLLNNKLSMDILHYISDFI